MNGKVNSIVLNKAKLENLTSIINFTQNVEEEDVLKKFTLTRANQKIYE